MNSLLNLTGQIPLLSLLWFLFFAFGCTVPTTQEAKIVPADSLQLPSSPMPQYRVGTKYIYSNGTWEKIVAIDGSVISWINHRGNRSIGSSDFTYKRFQWRSRSRHGKREFKQTEYLFSDSTKSLWPLQMGQKTRYDEFGSWYAKDGLERRYDNFWRCDVVGSERIAVAAGEFDSWKISCARYPNSFNYPGSRTREYRIWHYSPEVNHWVREYRDYNGYSQNREKELVAVVPDISLLTDRQDEMRQIKKHFQNTLEYNKSGVADIWTGYKNGLSVSITPVRTLKHPSGTVCRQYVQSVRKGEEADTYYGIACRAKNGSWQIPRR